MTQFTTIEQEIQDLRSKEEENYTLAQENGEEYQMKSFEILEGVIREVSPTEGADFWEDPKSATPELQRKYIGVTFEDWKDPIDWNIEDPEQAIPEGFEEVVDYQKNPYTWETIEYKKLAQLPPPPPPPTPQEIGEKITQEIFEGNPFAQVADLAKAQITTLALLSSFIPKETIRFAYGDLIETVRKISDERVKNGLSPYDLSFLD